MSERKIFVTGGVGYIGIHTVVELVRAGKQVVIVDNLSRSDERLLKGAEKILGKALTFVQADCRDRDAMRRVLQAHKDIDSVIHFAAFKSVNESVREPLSYYQNNLESLMVLLEVAREFAINKLIFSSSCTVYGQPDEIPVTEAAPFKKAESAYGATKQMCEEILRDVTRAQPDLKVISLRYFNPIGAHPSGLIGELPIGIPNNLVPYITQTAIGKRDKLTVFGDDYNTPDGSCLRDFIHVVDLAKAHLRAVEKIDEMPMRFQPINVGSGVPVSVLEVIKSFIRVTGVQLPYVIGPRRPGDIEKVYANPERSRQLLGWKTELTTDDALRDAWNWEKQIGNAPN
jgi:UDP-glucose 4-epimerase